MASPFPNDPGPQAGRAPLRVVAHDGIPRPSGPPVPLRQIIGIRESSGRWRRAAAVVGGVGGWVLATGVLVAGGLMLGRLLFADRVSGDVWLGQPPATVATTPPAAVTSGVAVDPPTVDEDESGEDPGPALTDPASDNSGPGSVGVDGPDNSGPGSASDHDVSDSSGPGPGPGSDDSSGPGPGGSGSDHSGSDGSGSSGPGSDSGSGATGFGGSGSGGSGSGGSGSG
jgi:hypothetical protein